MAVSPPIAGWIGDRTGAADGVILVGAALFALVPPAAIVFRTLNKARAVVAPLPEQT